MYNEKIHKKCNELQILLCSRLPLFLMNNGSNVSRVQARDTASLCSSLLNYTKPLCFYKRGLTWKGDETHSSLSLSAAIMEALGSMEKQRDVTFHGRNSSFKKHLRCFQPGLVVTFWSLHLHFLRGFKRNTLFQLRAESVTMVTAMFMPSLPAAK